MAVVATELRPRGAIGIVDAAVRLCARSGDLWALALPGGALVAAAVTWLAHAIASGRGLGLAAGMVTVAWFLRSLFQGAAAHFAETLLVEERPASLRQSLRAAAARAPTLFITTAVVLLVNLATVTVTFGLVVFFLSAQIAAYAVAMKTAGAPLAIHATCSRVLGPARRSTPGVRLALWLVVVLALNLHIAASTLITLGRKLLGLDLVFFDRFASLDNPVWLVVVSAVSFAITDPLRAAVGALLVVDGRVRQNGVDLQAAISQLPKRRARASGVAAVLALAMALGVAVPSPALAQAPPPPSSAELVTKLEELLEYCGGPDPAVREQLERMRELAPREAASLSRFVLEVEQLLEESEDCDHAITRVETGLAMALEAQEALAERALSDPTEKAKEILSRPEFAEAPVRPAPPPKAEVEEDVPEEEGIFARFWKWLREKLKEWMERRSASDSTTALSGGGATFAWIIVLVLGLGIVGVVLWLVFRGAQRDRVDLSHLEVTSSTPGDAGAGAEGALARPPETWSSLADALAAQGQYREAIRHLYLAVLSKLHALGAIDYDPGLSNWDYLRRFRGALAFKDDFRELTFRFDYAFYGNEALGEAAYARFRSRAGRILGAGTERPEAANA